MKTRHVTRIWPSSLVFANPTGSLFWQAMELVLVFLQLWRQSPIHAIRLAGNGKPPIPVWVSQKPGPQEPSLLYYRGLLYALMDNGVLVCLDGKTGEEVYRQRLGGDCNSTPVASDGRIYASNVGGTTFVVQAGREFKLLATNELGERITASPAITGNDLLYRTDSHLYCVGQAVPPNRPDRR